MSDDIQKASSGIDTLAPVQPRSPLGLVPNAAHQAPRGLFNMGGYDLAIVEFDDQGRCYDRAQMEAVAKQLERFGDEDAIIVVFVHGWKHDARSDDDNLISFQAVIQQTVDEEAKQAAGARPRPVLGVFVGWRGLTFYDRYGVIENLSFWNRQAAGRRVSVGAVRELFGRFRHYRNRRKDAGGAPLLIIAGHSFGGMIVYSALAQSLIEAATPRESLVKPRFADLVLLVNPAFEAERYLPIYDLVQMRRSARLALEQPPVFVSVTAQNDWATGLAFPIGNAFSLPFESYLDAEERQAMLQTMGHLAWMKTHALTTGPGGAGYALTAVDPAANSSPFWVVEATPLVIDGHDDIFGIQFLEFVAGLVFQHVAFSRASRAAG